MKKNVRQETKLKGSNQSLEQRGNHKEPKLQSYNHQEDCRRGDYCETLLRGKNNGMNAKTLKGLKPDKENNNTVNAMTRSKSEDCRKLIRQRLTEFKKKNSLKVLPRLEKKNKKEVIIQLRLKDLKYGTREISKKKSIKLESFDMSKIYSLCTQVCSCNKLRLN